MYWFKKLIFTIIIITTSSEVYATSDFSLLMADQDSLPGMLKKVTPTVVNLSVAGEISMMMDEKTLHDTPPGEDMSIAPDATPDHSSGLLPVTKKFMCLGSGVIVDAAKGYVMTNAHVVKNSKSIVLTLSDGRKFMAKVIGTDNQSDVAILAIKPERLSAMKFADSDDVVVGQPAFAIGNPFGVGQTVTSGIISGLGRSNLHIENFEDFIQTDASINPGNSGGALINRKGEMIGLNTAILGPSGGNVGIGFAIPANMAHSVMMQLIQYGSIHRGLMGVIVNDLTPDVASSFGVTEDSGAVVSMVTPGSPADKAGLKVGDIILVLNNKKIKNAAGVRNYIGLQQVGAKFSVEFLRHGKSMTTQLLTLDPDVYQKEVESKNPFLYGADLQSTSVLTVAQGYLQGVTVLRLELDSPAWRAGLREGDMILSANHEPVTSVESLVKASKTNTRQLLLNVFRPSINASSYVVIF